MSTPKKFYLTTPIYYVNARPHIGHAYSTIVADVIARRHRLLGEDVFFLTGTDEHGQKIERSAAAAGIPPQQFADQVSKTFSDLWKRMGITNDDFIRTTEPRHKERVQKLFATLQANGAIEKNTYTGQYCVSDEAYVEVGPGEPCPECGRITETISETNYFFRLSEYGAKLEALIVSNELLIQPESRRNEVLSFVRSGLKDLSISRTSFKWGIPVPGDEAHVIYVWLDALANYMTAIGYGSDAPEDIEKFNRYWPADLHLVGKEIIRFHCVYWPAFLLAAKLPLPKSIVANGWLLFQDSNNVASKMSKSLGNVVRTETILDAFGPLCPPTPIAPQTLSSFAEDGGSAVPLEALQPLAPSKQQQDLFASDVLRYFLLREIPFGQDGNFSFEALWGRYNSDLANGYGNLISRILNMIHQYFDGRVPSSAYGLVGTTIFRDGMEKIGGTPETADEFEYKLNSAADSHNFSAFLEITQQFIKRVDQFLSDKKPWKLNPEIADERIEREHVLYAAADAIKNITFLLHPFMPYTTALAWAQLGFDVQIKETNLVPEMLNLRNLNWGDLKPGTKLGTRGPIFPRADKGIIQTMIDTEERNAQEVIAAKSKTSLPVSNLTDEKSPTAEEDHLPTHPAAAPRNASVLGENPGTHVGGSAAITTERPGTPPHSEAPSSAPFANAAAASATPDTPQIAIDDFVKIDLRVAKIIVAERIPKADKLLRLEVDLGYEKRQILSGIAEWYQPEDLIGRNIVVIANLAPRKMRGLESHGMLLAASHGENGKPILATFGEEIALGSRLR